MGETGFLKLAEPFLQYGFAGYSVLLLGALLWMSSKFVKVLMENNKVIERNTAAIASLSERTDDELILIRQIREEQLVSRNRMAEREPA